MPDQGWNARGVLTTVDQRSLGDSFSDSVCLSSCKCFHSRLLCYRTTTTNKSYAATLWMHWSFHIEFACSFSVLLHASILCASLCPSPFLPFLHENPNLLLLCQLFRPEQSLNRIGCAGHEEMLKGLALPGSFRPHLCILESFSYYGHWVPASMHGSKINDFPCSFEVQWFQYLFCFRTYPGWTFGHESVDKVIDRAISMSFHPISMGLNADNWNMLKLVSATPIKWMRSGVQSKIIWICLTNASALWCPACKHAFHALDLRIPMASLQLDSVPSFITLALILTLQSESFWLQQSN